MSLRKLLTVLDAVVWIAAMVPPILVTIYTLRYTVNVPYKDHWGHVPFIAEAVRGVFRPAALWEQINEHRVPTARLIQGLLAWATAWDVRWEAYVDLGFGLGTLVVLWLVVWHTVRPHAPQLAAWVALVTSMLHLSLIHI